MKRKIIMFNMSGIYERQLKLLKYLKEDFKDFSEINCKNMSGINCYCDDCSADELKKAIKETGCEGIHFIDGGNYHYISQLYTDEIKKKCSLLVFDHHPDMQQPAFGSVISCGGWVKNVLTKENNITKVCIVGVKDELAAQHYDEDDRVLFITESEMIDIMWDNNKMLLCERIFSFLNSEDIYISIDKDVLSESECLTNWDQGSMNVEFLKYIICEVKHKYRIIGTDICGEMENGMNVSEECNSKNEKINIDLVRCLC